MNVLKSCFLANSGEYHSTKMIEQGGLGVYTQNGPSWRQKSCSYMQKDINFTVPKNSQRDTYKTRKSPFRQLETAKTHLAHPKTSHLAPNQKPNLFCCKISGKKLKWGPVEDIKKFSKKVSKPKKEVESLIVSKKIGEGDPCALEWFSC